MKKSGIIILIMLMCFWAFNAKAKGMNEEKVYCQASISDEFVDNEILVVIGQEKSLNFYDFKTSDFINVGCESIEDLTKDRKEEVLSAVNGDNNNIDLNKFRRILLLTLNKHDKQNVLDCIKKIEQRNDVYCAEPNYLSKNEIENVENIENSSGVNQRSVGDDFYYNIDEEGGIGQWSTNNIDLQSVWEIEDDLEDLPIIYVGVVDGGIKADESINGVCETELIGKVDQTLSVSFMQASNVYAGEDDHNDEPLVEEEGNAHGTFIAGILAARSDDDHGIRGVSNSIKVVSYKIAYGYSAYNEDYGCMDGKAQMIRVLNHAQTNNIKILNISQGFEIYSLVEETAMNNYNGLIICAAGNYAENIDETPVYPAAYTCDNIISVGASKINNNIWELSNYGATSVDLFAPGHNIISIGEGMGDPIPVSNFAGYRMDSGTSYAAPYVAGVAAMIWSKVPTLTWSGVKEIILSNVDQLESLEGKCVTGGKLNAYKAYIFQNSNNHHNHVNYVYTIYDGDYHLKECSGCSYSVLEAHIWMPFLRLPTNPSILKVCDKCGERKV